VHTHYWDFPQVDKVRLVLGRHKHDPNPVEKLHLSQWSYSHVEEDTVKDGHWDEFENWHHKDGKAHQKEDAQMGQTLLSIPELKVLLILN